MGAEDLKELKAKLKRQEETEGGSGAIPLTPKQMLLDVSDLSAKDPDHKYRWVASKDPQNIQKRILEGYTQVPESEGGRNLGGSLVLMKTPQRAVEARVARQNRAHESRLVQHNTEMAKVVESVVKEMKDRFGVSIDPSRVFVSEA